MRAVSSCGSKPLRSCSISKNAGSLSLPTIDSTGTLTRAALGPPELPSLQLGDFDAEERICVLYGLLPAPGEMVIQQLAIAWREDCCQPAINCPRTVALPITLHCRGHVLAEFLTRRTARANAQRRFHERERFDQVRPIQRELQRHEATIRVSHDVRAPHAQAIEKAG